MTTTATATNEVPSLPYELLSAIAAHLRPRDLPSLARASRTLNAASEPVLYCTLSSTSLRPRAMCAALRSVRKRGRGACVHELSLDLSCWTKKVAGKERGLLLRGFGTLVQDAIRGMHNLERVTMLGFGSRMTRAAVDGCDARLRVLMGDVMPEVRWLEEQRMLEVLVLVDKERRNEKAELRVSDAALPRLRILCAGADVVRQLSLGRPALEHVAQDIALATASKDKETNGDADDQRVQHPGRMPALRTLGIQYRAVDDACVIRAGCPPFDGMDGAGLSFEGVTRLDIYVPTFHHFEALASIAPLVQRFPALRELELAGGHLFGTMDREAMRVAAESWRAQCGTLQEVVFRDRADAGRYKRNAEARVYAYDQDEGGIRRDERADGRWMEAGGEYEYWADRMIWAVRR
ncbi:hypothetical protein PUNSTDRAFT_139447 [Punctularia strigosozonata HHB-11173 SS5]|uniref:F-box domain-containing protein n=1 Tax=Punctularia strigosozonata (strain HHB-11173) TaxID=741275 RepID=R7S2T9_PUNST|nr:uncharacterized protein PUNSTDRAFT_139447 [Punctularia strigosozonata HHB-11173 SS5]EIN03566.1 hypothetical protein PUNSTDRAFT_139447 [Punctularia strigosozonata HHB-11173 SS5]